MSALPAPEGSNDPLDRIRDLLRGARRVETGIEMFVVEITPEIAKALLATNTNIRKKKPATGSKYGGDMKAGRWVLTGQPIIIDRNGKLRDGQHRCDGCVEDNAPFVSLVILGVEPDADLNLDSGVKRNLGDYLGAHDLASAAELARAIKLGYFLVEFKDATGSQPSNETLIRWFNDNHAITDSLAAVVGFKKRWPKALGLHMGAAVRYMAIQSGVSAEDVDAFFEMVAAGGENQQVAESAFQLRQFMTDASEKKKDKPNEVAKVALTIKALNHFTSGRAIPRAGLKYTRGGKRGEAFPTPEPSVTHSTDDSTTSADG